MKLNVTKIWFDPVVKFHLYEFLPHLPSRKIYFNLPSLKLVTALMMIRILHRCPIKLYLWSMRQSCMTVRMMRKSISSHIYPLISNNSVMTDQTQWLKWSSKRLKDESAFTQLMSNNGLSSLNCQSYGIVVASSDHSSYALRWWNLAVKVVMITNKMHRWGSP